MNNTIIPPITAPDYGFSLSWPLPNGACTFVDFVCDNQWTNKPNGRLPTTTSEITVDGNIYNGSFLLRTPSNLTQILSDTQYRGTGASEKLEYIASELRAWRRDGHEFWSEAVFFAYHGRLCMQDQKITDLLPKMDAAIRHGMTRLLELYLQHLTDVYMTPSQFPSHVEVLNEMGKAKPKPKITLKLDSNRRFSDEFMGALPNVVHHGLPSETDSIQYLSHSPMNKSNIIDFAFTNNEDKPQFELLAGLDGTFDMSTSSSSCRWSGSTLVDPSAYLDTAVTESVPAASTIDSGADIAGSKIPFQTDLTDEDRSILLPSSLPTELNGFSPPGTVFTPSPTDSIFSDATTLDQLPDTPLSDTTFAEADMAEPLHNIGNTPPLPLPLSADETEALFRLHTTQTLNWVRDYFLHVYARLPAASPSTITTPKPDGAHSSASNTAAAPSPNITSVADGTKEQKLKATFIATGTAYDPSIAVLQQYIKCLPSVREVFSQWFWLNERKGPAQVKIDIAACGQLLTLGKLVGFGLSSSATAGHDGGKKTARSVKTEKDDHVFDSRAVVGRQEDWIMRDA
jgi:hypothetical protein